MEKKRSAIFWIIIILSTASTLIPLFGFLWYSGYSSQGIAMPLKAKVWFLQILGLWLGAVGFFFFKWWGRLLIQVCLGVTVVTNITTIFFWAVYDPSMLGFISVQFGLGNNIIPLLVLYLTTRPAITEQFGLKELVFGLTGVTRKVVSNILFLVIISVSIYGAHTGYMFEKKHQQKVNTLDFESLFTIIKDKNAKDPQLGMAMIALEKWKNSGDTEKIIKIIRETKTPQGQSCPISNIRLKSILIESLGSIGNREAVIGLLEIVFDENEYWGFRQDAHRLLRKITGANIGEDDWLQGSNTKQWVEQWKEWWEQNKEQFK